MEQDKAEVVITDVKIPFWSLVWLLVKLALAAIPVSIILFLFFAGLAFIIGIPIAGLMRVR